MGRRTIAAAIMVTALATPTAALADDISTDCTDEVTGEPGLQQFDGACITPAEYDALFSPENLNTIPSPTKPEVSIAEHAGLVADGTPASERPLGQGVTAEPFTFVEAVAYANGLPIRLA